MIYRCFEVAFYASSPDVASLRQPSSTQVKVAGSRTRQAVYISNKRFICNRLMRNKTTRYLPSVGADWRSGRIRQHGEPFRFEAGADVASNIESWKHVRVFSPWRYNMAEAAVDLLRPMAGNRQIWLTTGEELIEDYFRPSQCTDMKLRVLQRSRDVCWPQRPRQNGHQGREELPFVIQVDIDGESSSP